jgi:hypothetical protein
MTSIDQLKSAASLKMGFARNNQFLVQLPSNLGGKPQLGGLVGVLTQLSNLLGGADMNIICASAELPGKRVLTHDRAIGAENQRVAYGYAVDDVTLTFYCLNDYGIVKYFDEWRSITISETPGEANYKKDYARSIKIHQLRKPLIGAGANLGPIRVNLGLGGGSVYSVELIDAFPINVSTIELNNELDGLVQVSVTIAYTNWQNTSSGQGWISASAGLGSLGL